MNRWNLLFCLLALLGCVLSPNNFANADTNDSIEPIARKLLFDHWEKNTTNRETSKRLFYDSTATEQVLVAYTLNRIKHNRFREARVPADELTSRFPKNLDGWVLRIWLDTVTDQYDRALIGIQLLKRKMRDDQTLSAEKRREIDSRIARAFGFFQGPVAGKINDLTLNTTLIKFADGMTPERLKRFNAERTRTLDRYDQIMKDKADLEKQEIQKAQIVANLETKNIAAQDKALDARKQQIQPDIDRIRNDGEQRIAGLETRLSPLQQELAGLSTTINNLDFNLGLVFRDRLLQQNLLLQDNDPFIQALIISRINQLDFQAAAIRNNLFNAQARANNIATQANQLAAERERVGRSYISQIDQLATERNRVDRQKRKNAKRLGQIAKGPKPSTKVRVADIEAEAFSNYDPFQVELARQDFLDAYSDN